MWRVSSAEEFVGQCGVTMSSSILIRASVSRVSGKEPEPSRSREVGLCAG